MKKLKKTGIAGLALLLMLALVLPSLPAAAAAFQDNASIDPALTDDIELMVALGVFKGDEKGNFNPNETVTRAQAAKMIYVLKNGGIDDNAAAYAGFSTYSDVKTGFWADGYIHYCTISGYMDGWTEQGQKVFNPNGQIKGIEMMSPTAPWPRKPRPSIPMENTSSMPPARLLPNFRKTWPM